MVLRKIASARYCLHYHNIHALEKNVLVTAPLSQCPTILLYIRLGIQMEIIADIDSLSHLGLFSPECNMRGNFARVLATALFHEIRHIILMESR